MIQYMRDADMVFDELTEWEKVLDLYASHTNVGQPVHLTIRYLGTVLGPKRPIDRYLEDLTERKSGVLHEFCQALEVLFPGHAGGVVELIEDATLGPKGTERIRDDDERVLIEYFGHATLLNRQDGGLFTSFLPTDHVASLYRNLDVRFYFRFLEDAAAPSPSMRSDLVDHFKRLQQYANSNGPLTGTDRRRFGDTLRQAMTEQSMPYLYKKAAVPLVIIGKDITLKDYIAETTFWSGRGQASSLVSDFLRRIVRVEARALGKNQEWSDASLDLKAFPFVDLWCWMRQKSPVKAAEFLQEYLRIVRPVITATFSRPVNTLTRADFATDATAARTLVSIVGQPTLQFYDSDDEDSAFINMPHIHPGRDKYTAKNVELRNVIDATWKVNFILGEIAMDVLDTFLASDGELPSRKALCEKVLAEFTSCKDNKRYEAFFQNFEEARDDLRIRLSSVRGGLTSASDMYATRSDDVRPVLDGETRAKLSGLGLAEGDPGSQERESQLGSIWDKDVAELHLALPHGTTGKDRTRWIRHFRYLRPGQSLFLHSLSGLSAVDFARNLVEVLRPDWNTQDVWFEASDSNAYPELQNGLWFHRHQLSSTGEKLRIRNKFPDEYSTSYDLQGRNVGVTPSSGFIRIPWLKDNGQACIVNLCVKLAIPPAKRAFEPRALHFTQAGIDIVDSGGNPFRFQVNKDQEATATVTKEALPGTQNGTDAYEMWKAVLNAHGIPLPADASTISDRKWGKAGVTFLPRSAKGESTQQNRPLKEEDGLYPLMVFLHTRFPVAGVFRTQSTDRMADSTEDLQRFVDFLKEPAYSAHPYAAKWRAALERTPPDVALLGKNLAMLRSCDQKRTQRYNANLVHLKKVDRMVRETIFNIGAPGTGAIDQAYVAPSPRTKKVSKADGKQLAAQRELGGPIYKSGRKAVKADEESSIEDEDAEEQTISPIQVKTGGGRKKPKLARRKGLATGDEDLYAPDPVAGKSHSLILLYPHD